MTQVKTTIIATLVIAVLILIISYISFEIRSSNGQHSKWLFGIENNIPNYDTLAEPNVQHEKNNFPSGNFNAPVQVGEGITQINQPNAPIRIGGKDTYN